MKIQVQHQQNEKLSLLKQVELFRELREYELDIIASNSDFMSVKKGSPVYSAGSGAEAMYAVKTGRVGIIGMEESGDVMVAQIFEGESFGEMDFFGGTEMSASAFADEDCTLLRFPKEGQTLNAICESIPEISARLLMRIVFIMTSRIHKTRLLLEEKENWVQTLRRQLLCDGMTGLFNQTYVKEELQSAVEKNDRPSAFMIIKPDNFKEINDACGHDAGDRVLVLLAIFLQSELTEDDIAIRFKGDEFAALVKASSRDEAVERAKSIGQTFAAIDLSRICPGLNIRVMVSIGISFYPDDAANAATLVSTAHERMFAARNNGGNRIKSRNRQ